MSDWETVPLASLVAPGRSISYGIVQPGAQVPNGVPILRVGDIRGGRISTESTLRVEPAVEAAYSRTRLAGGELLLTLVGTVGETAVVPPELAGWNVARAVAVIPIRQDVGAHWVRLALDSPTVREMINGRLNTTVQATLNLKDVAQLPVLLPSEGERRRIAAIIGAFDDKIELNRRMNQTLEAVAQTTFESWFVDFDPVRARAAGEADESIHERLGASGELLAALPDSMHQSDGHEVPAGWSVKGLDEIAIYLNGLALQKYPATGDESLPVIKIAQLRLGHSVGADRAGLDVPAPYVIGDGDVLFSWSGSLEVDLWTGGPGALNQHLFKVTSPTYPKWFFYLWTKHHLQEFRQIAADKATTMGHIQRKHLSKAKAFVPPQSVIDAAHKVLAPLIDRITAAQLEARSLGDVRDSLLPRLLSGELIPDMVE